MCLAIPGKVDQIEVIDGMRSARILFGGIARQACLDFVPEAKEGDYVLVHVGFALSRIDEAEARHVFEFLANLFFLRIGSHARYSLIDSQPQVFVVDILGRNLDLLS